MKKINFNSKLFEKFEKNENTELEFVVGGKDLLIGGGVKEKCKTKEKNSCTSSAGECYVDTDNKKGKEECVFTC